MAPAVELHFAFGLTPHEVERLRDIMRRECGVELTANQAWERAIELLSLGKLLAEASLARARRREFERRPT